MSPRRQRARQVAGDDQSHAAKPDAPSRVASPRRNKPLLMTCLALFLAWFCFLLFVAAWA